MKSLIHFIAVDAGLNGLVTINGNTIAEGEIKASDLPRIRELIGRLICAERGLVVKPAEITIANIMELPK